MFNKRSDYALNKINPDAIVCSDVTGADIELTCEQFANEEEFLFWKQWSDNDYKIIEDNGRGYYDHTVSLIEELDAIGASFEDELIALMEKSERNKICAECVAQIHRILTETQFRRLWLYCVEEKTEQEIAEMENVTQQAVAKSIAKAKRFSKKFSFTVKRGCKNA